MLIFVPLVISIAFFISGCTTTSKELPPCEPGKVYIQPVPPVCKPKSKPVLNCAEPIRLGTPYTTLDEANFRVAIPRCAELFPRSPCMKVFHKVADYTYRVTCGAENPTGPVEQIEWKDRSK